MSITPLDFTLHLLYFCSIFYDALVVEWCLIVLLHDFYLWDLIGQYQCCLWDIGDIFDKWLLLTWSRLFAIMLAIKHIVWIVIVHIACHVHQQFGHRNDVLFQKSGRISDSWALSKVISWDYMLIGKQFVASPEVFRPIWQVIGYLLYIYSWCIYYYLQ